MSTDDGGDEPSGRMGRVRKKSAKVLEMEEFEEAEKKHFTKKGVTESPKVAKAGTTPPPESSPMNPKKIKIREIEDSTDTTPLPPEAPAQPVVKKVHLAPSATLPISPTGTPPQGIPVGTAISMPKKISQSKTAASAAPVLSPPKNMPTSPIIVQTSPQAGSSPQGTTSPQGSVIKLLLSSPAVPTAPSVSTKAVTKTSPQMELSASSDTPSKKKSKIIVKAGHDPAEDHLKSAQDADSDQRKTSLPPGASSPPQAKVISVAADKKEGLKMKLILSGKGKMTSPPSLFTPKTVKSFGAALESVDEMAGVHPVKKVKKKKPAKSEQSVIEAMPNLAALVTSGVPEKEASPKKKMKSAKQANTMLNASENAASSSVAMDISIEAEEEPNLVIADEPKIPKKRGLLTSISRPKKKQKLIPKMDLPDVPRPDGDIAALAANVKHTIAKKLKKKKMTDEQGESKRKRPPTAYTLYCNANRNKLVADNPGIDFAQISRRLGEMWQLLSKKEKMSWKRKAKKLAGKGSTLISTGKTNKLTSQKISIKAIPSSSTVAVAKPAPQIIHKPGIKVSPEPPFSPVKGLGIDPIDVAAHLKLLGDSLSLIGTRLREHKGLIAVQGSMSVLLDSLLCSFAPLLCLTAQLPETNGCSTEIHANTLDNIAYVMPGL
ncbi:HMG domain-containing protein 4-like isoform X2 [Gigantopelta aegis]|uniref:HMG domain-containing protein 4-like isoform X2 n=1 Tax=Gigantopelta aegis TaxID=1735272 RepID=UPI001B889926|nr:HMG domain-containing protein 4-like isoform X2 [Gigantopelta aegis]